MKRVSIVLICVFSVLPAFSEQVSFDEFLNQTIEKSYQLHSSQLNAQISKTGIKSARSDYFPTLGAFATTERYNDMTSGNSQVTAVGSDVFLNKSYFQDVAGLGLSYNLFDFGVRRRKLDISKLDKTEKDLILKKDLRDLKLDAVDLYAQALLIYKELCVKKDTLALQNELFTINSRLKTAGEISEVDVTDQEIRVSELQTEIDELKNNLAKKMAEVTYYTQKDYNIEDLELKDLPDDAGGFITCKEGEPIKLAVQLNTQLPPESLEYKIYDLEIAKKQKEYEAQKKVNYPKLRFDTRYSLYGSNGNNLMTSVGDMSPRGVNIRVSTSFTLFDGMKNRAQIEKVKLDLEKLKVEKEKTIAELTRKYMQIQHDSKNSLIQLENNTKTLVLVNKNLDMLGRLNVNGVVDRSSYLRRKLALLDKKLDLEQNQVKNVAAQYKLKVLNSEEKADL